MSLLSQAELDELMADTYDFDLEEQAAMDKAQARIHRERRDYMRHNARKQKGERHHHESK
ncbi:MAG: hypothetical protein ACI4OH_05125 [Mitsuokella sp.]|uniref:hypothetical protein n=1 Tax=Mitsuokella sp. TaxID=2049034 RepID=UPI003F05B891